GVDITSGLPRVEEIFEARVPKGKAPIAAVDGVVESIDSRGSLRVIKIRPLAGKVKSKAKVNLKSKKKDGALIEYVTPSSVVFVKEGQVINKGQVLSEGSLDLREILKYQGVDALRHYIINEVQRIYVPEGATINDKHIEVMVRQMLSRVLVADSGDSDFLVGDMLEKGTFLRVNRELKKLKGQPAKAVQKVFGISRIAITTESFLSAASFQETVRVLVSASIEGRIDYMRGLKENVIIGKLIPAGTGLQGIPAGALPSEKIVEKIEE
ncbi:MAG: DNA-directed RNA polymerase subunit beta', partial [bacterium]|nr:DNA-directed RNA polymerase subunit beta' [bacterium]